MNAAQVGTLVAELFGAPALSVTRQTFGHRSVTYDVALPERNVIVRTNADPQVFASTEHNLAVLSGIGLPVPQVLASDYTKSRYPFAYMLLDKIPGRDLRYELSAMTPVQMTRLAAQIVGFQRRVMTLPRGTGYGYVGIGEQGRFAVWRKLMINELRETVYSDQQAMAKTDPLLATWQIRIQRKIAQSEAYFRTVPPTCFLDDITVKNVIVQNGELQGPVDFDGVCYGDPLFWLALTATGVVSDVGTRELFYVEELKRIWGLTPEEDAVLALYSAAMSLDFLHRFALSETPEWKTRMLAAVEGWMMHG